ncbi:MAG: hypothetical protein K5790_02245 [Nitrosopumilus sp.]|uniref:hypothetical protein n=1 Tax=Nitrosopumilus sp. TaxID=2024843 RepID=UPI00247C9F86|nr:hypothetical protein [Nitrosopumilus sp.]MCV0392095.1 hypothetical protein [Nitrosopumilus sp.]
MSVNPDLLEKLMKSNEISPLKFTLSLNDKKYPITGVSITNSPTPVNEPTTRGGVYFSDKFAYKMKGVIEDLSVIPLLTKKMLGPNTEFADLKIETSIDSLNLEIITNLTNSVQTPTSIELSMIIVKIESV